MSHLDWCNVEQRPRDVWAPCDCHEPDTDWAPELPCGGISTNGATPPWCEVHMKPWGHRQPRA